MSFLSYPRIMFCPRCEAEVSTYRADEDGPTFCNRCDTTITPRDDFGPLGHPPLDEGPALDEWREASAARFKAGFG